MSVTNYILFECATGYAVFQKIAGEEVGAGDHEFQKSLQKFQAFQQFVKLTAFAPYESPEMALEESICICEGVLSDFLKQLLQATLAKKSKKGAWELGVSDPKLGSAIHETLGFEVVSNESITEFVRLIRLHAEKLLPDHSEGDITKAQIGLGHAFSRNKVKFNVHRNDNMIIQGSALLEHLDKGVNLLGMRVKEWYGWHFPELAKEVPEPLSYSRIVLLLGNRAELAEKDAEDVKGEIAGVLESHDEAVATRVYDKAITSMGGELAEVDWTNIEAFATRVVALAEYRLQLQQYLIDKMMTIAPNLTELMGQNVGAKLISKAGSLTNLAKAPASTIQILGAEKALFRALKKKKGKTPKYGIIFHSTFIQRAAKENRGKISRYLANKAALASRIDCFMENPHPIFGQKLKEQVESRLNFFDTGAKPRSNKDVMNDAVSQYYAILGKKSAGTKRKRATEEQEEAPKKKKKRTE